MLDQERRELERQVQAGDALALPKLQALNDRIAISTSDAEYLEKYFEICDNFLGASMAHTEAEKQLKKLNQEYQTKVGSKTLRDGILGSRFARFEHGDREEFEDDGSDVSCKDNDDCGEVSWGSSCHRCYPRGLCERHETCREADKPAEEEDGWVPSSICW